MSKKLARQSINETVYRSEDSIYDCLETYISFLSAQLNKVPARYRPEVRISIDCSSYYDSSEMEILISYIREETDEEYDARTKVLREAEKKRKATVRKKEVDEFNKLARKLGQPEIQE
jgi:hypothetical protein